MDQSPLLSHDESDDPRSATVEIDTETRAPNPVEPYLFGKFCEHLGLNIYHGMEAQILFNPVFGEWHFRGAERRQSGGFFSENDAEKIDRYVRDHVRSLAYPESTDPDALLAAYRDGLAFGWLPTDDDALAFSPDTGPAGNRAQRIEIESGTRAGVYQRTHLPAHRVREYEFRCKVRSLESNEVALSVAPDGGEPVTEATIDVGEEWSIVEGTLELPDDVDPDGIFEFGLTADGPANVVVERVLLYPDDHVDHADPEIVEFLRESELPLLRWPGGNFVSGYDWRDGIGPVDERPTRINPAWHGLEYNLFGTDEFVEFCEAVGCEPSICVNAGDGTPAEAAKWVEYCNGDPDETEMGRLRAEHGHPDPYDVTYWEIGNELYGEWQVNWTTPEGNADRYERFREAMLEADSDIEVTATGQVTVSRPPDWNDVLFERCGETIRAVSEHILAGGQVGPETDPDELFHAFMGYSEQLGEQFRDTRERMREAGVTDPKIDVTELQLFAHFQEDEEGGDAEEMGRDEAGTGEETDDGGLSPETMPTPVTISEALYDATIRHEFARTGEFVEMLTHSATVNHGGGLWKDGERVWANPCHYGRSMTNELAGKTPVRVDLECATIGTENAFREIDPFEGVPAVDAFAALDEDEATLTVTLVNRRSGGDPIAVSIDPGVPSGDDAEVATLSGETMYDRNTRDAPERIVPESTTVPVEDGAIEIDLAPYSLTKATVELE